MGQALYRKYRPKSLSEVVGQEHVTTTLANALKTGKISHAYLFTGPHGVGKTSVARILAHEVNGLTYDDDSNHLDIIEIDAASNRRIDEIRDLRDKVHITPTSAKYKVYIIDEVHMLTKEAFNALLKTLEEPPAHVIFILATTEAHKLPETIISRTQRYSFKPIDKAQAVEHLKSIAKTEKIKADSEALELIAEHGDGSFRDSISLLDQSSDAGGQITLPDVQRMLGIAPEAVISEIMAGLSAGSVRVLLSTLSRLREQGYQPASIAKQLANDLRSQLLNQSSDLDEKALLELLRKLLDIPTSQSPDQLLEIVLLEVVLNNSLVTELDRPFSDVSISTPNEIEPIAETKKPAAAKHEADVPGVKMPTEAVSATTFNSFDDEVWPAILGELKKQHSTLYSVLRMSRASLDNDTLLLQFKFPFHQKQMKDSKNHQKFVTIASSFVNEPLKIEYTLSANIELPSVPNIPIVGNKSSAPDVETISNIFGGAEVLDS